MFLSNAMWLEADANHGQQGMATHWQSVLIVNLTIECVFRQRGCCNMDEVYASQS